MCAFNIYLKVWGNRRATWIICIDVTTTVSQVVVVSYVA